MQTKQELQNLLYEKMSKEQDNYRNNHYRVVNDIFQSFNLHRSISGRECTVEFSIIPLSVGYDIRKDTVNSHHLKNFENSAEWFEYDKNSIESMDACVDKLLYYMIKYLLPIYKS